LLDIIKTAWIWELRSLWRG